ncbi:phage holin family protein [Enterococcus faecalis]|uniref:phage holin family protein n=1 Tax=Enterococcus faecalis TaxID=1351 RepID=UPI0018A7B210|nr:phage holin family protein [Enterococcus faecalis]
MDFSKIELMPLVVLGCLAVGFVIKNTNILKDKYNQFIPLIVFILGILISWWMQGKITPENTIYGALSGLASTGLHQSFKNFIGDDKNDIERN